MPADPKKPKRTSRIGQSKKATRGGRLLASSKLPEAKIRDVIRCYAFARSPADARTRTGLSHVTIYRLYGLIRQRLAFFDLLISKEKFIDFINEGEEENGLHFDWEAFERYIGEEVRRHRGIKPKNRALYVSEAILKFEGHYTPQQLYRLIMITIRAGGPLNRRPVFGYSRQLFMEIMRLDTLRTLALIRKRGMASEFSWLFPALDELDRSIERRF